MITKTTITNPLPFPTMLPFVIIWIGAQNLIFYTDMADRPHGRVTHRRHLAETARGAGNAALCVYAKNSNNRFYVCISMNIVIHFVVSSSVSINLDFVSKKIVVDRFFKKNN